MELPGGSDEWLAPSPSPPGPAVPDRHDEHGVGTFIWPPVGTSTWPPVGTFSWPRTPHHPSATPLLGWSGAGISTPSPSPLSAIWATLSPRATHSPRGGLNLQPQSGAGSVSRTETTRLEEKSSRVVFFNCGCALDNAERASSHSTTWLTVANATPAPRCVRWRAQGPRCLDASRQMSGFGILTGLIGGSGMPAVSAVDGDRAGQVNRITKSP